MKKLKGYPDREILDTVGISHFTREEFDLLKRRAHDKDGLDDDYDSYVANVDNVKANMKKMGFNTVDVPLTVDEIEEYCMENGVENIGATRAQMVQMKLSGML